MFIDVGGNRVGHGVDRSDNGGVDLNDNFRRAVPYADRILRGAKPSELPVQAPVKFELVINLKTSKAIGIDVPLQLKQRADAVIE